MEKDAIFWAGSRTNDRKARVATAPAASAVRVIPTRASGLCSAGSHRTIKAKPDNGRLEVELRIDSNRVGQLWTVRITMAASQPPWCCRLPPVPAEGAVWAVEAQKVDRSGPVQLGSITT